jgi:hypothetical protein
MSQDLTLRRLRAFLVLLAAALFAGTIGELLAAKHYGDPIQLVPFALCGLGLLALGVIRTRPSRGTILAVRALMIVIALGSVLGVYEHIAGNYEFVREVRPGADAWSLAKATLTGRDPLLAPGILAVGAALAIAATYATAALEAARPAVERRRLAGERGALGRPFPSEN